MKDLGLDLDKIEKDSDLSPRGAAALKEKRTRSKSPHVRTRAFAQAHERTRTHSDALGCTRTHSNALKLTQNNTNTKKNLNSSSPHTHSPQAQKEKCDAHAPKGYHSNKAYCSRDNCDAIVVKIGYCAHPTLISSIRHENDYAVTFVLPANPDAKDVKINRSLNGVWTEFSGKSNTMDKGRWLMTIEALGLITPKKLRQLDVDLTFNIIKPVDHKVLKFEHFCRGLNLLAHKLYPAMEDKSPIRKLVARDLKLKNI